MTGHVNPELLGDIISAAMAMPQNAPTPTPAAQPPRYKNRFTIQFSTVSCGVHLLSEVMYCGPKFQPRFPEWSCRRVVSDVYNCEVMNSGDGAIYSNRKCAMIVFSDNDNNGGGIELAKYITEHKLGGISEVGPVRNPNSGRQIRTWTWVLDYDAMKKHLEATK